MADVDQAKQAAREHVWALLEREQAVPLGVHGRIPSFYGAEDRYRFLRRRSPTQSE